MEEQIESEQARKYRVSLRDMARKAETATLLAAHDGIHFHHLRADVLEADLRLDHRDSEALAQPVGHRGGRERSDSRTSLPSYLQQVQKQQRIRV